MAHSAMHAEGKTTNGRTLVFSIAVGFHICVSKTLLSLLVQFGIFRYPGAEKYIYQHGMLKPYGFETG